MFLGEHLPHDTLGSLLGGGWGEILLGVSAVEHTRHIYASQDQIVFLAFG